MRPALLPMVLPALLVVGCVFDGSGVPAAKQGDGPADSRPPDGPVIDLARDQGADRADLATPDLPQPQPDLPPVDAFVCPGKCTSCLNGVCRIACGNGTCSCPPGLPCELTCPLSGCHASVDCSQATACTVNCGLNACRGTITCGTGPCSVNCLGNACSGPIDCSASCGCSVSCSPLSCAQGTLCPAKCTQGCGPNDNCKC